MPSHKNQNTGNEFEVDHMDGSQSPTLQGDTKKRKRKLWSDDSMLSALRAVQSGSSVCRAAKTFCVPRTTLQDRVQGRVAHGTKPGPAPYLSTVEEGELAGFLLKLARDGNSKSRKEILTITERVLDDKGRLPRNKKVTDGWFRRFCERQPELSQPKEIVRKTSTHADCDNNNETSVQSDSSGETCRVQMNCAIPDKTQQQANCGSSGEGTQTNRGGGKTVCCNPETILVSSGSLDGGQTTADCNFQMKNSSDQGEPIQTHCSVGSVVQKDCGNGENEPEETLKQQNSMLIKEVASLKATVNELAVLIRKVAEKQGIDLNDTT